MLYMLLCFSFRGWFVYILCFLCVFFFYSLCPHFSFCSVDCFNSGRTLGCMVFTRQQRRDLEREETHSLTSSPITPPGYNNNMSEAQRTAEAGSQPGPQDAAGDASAILAMLQSIQTRLSAIETVTMAPPSTRTLPPVDTDTLHAGGPRDHSTPGGGSTTGPYYTPTLTAPRPVREVGKFTDDMAQHPVAFVRQLEQYFTLAGVHGDFQLACALDCLEGAPAVWGEAFRQDFKDFDDFRAAFLKEFWGEQRQRDVRMGLYGGTYSRSVALSMADYFLQLVTKARYLTPPMHDGEVIAVALHHYPLAIERTLLAANPSSVAEALALLRKLDYSEARKPPGQQSAQRHTPTAGGHSEQGYRQGGQAGHKAETGSTPSWRKTPTTTPDKQVHNEGTKTLSGN